MRAGPPITGPIPRSTTPTSALPLHPRRVGARARVGTVAATVADRVQHLAVLPDRLIEPGHLVEPDEPQPQAQREVGTQRVLEVGVVRTPVHEVVDPLVEAGQRARGAP